MSIPFAQSVSTVISRDEYFEPIAPRFDLPLLERSRVTVVGVGTVGSRIAELLAQNGVGCLVVVDGDRLEVRNLLRHVLTREYLGRNKAAALAENLRARIPGLEIRAESHYVDSAMPDDALDDLLSEADLIIAATDRRDAQRRVAQRAWVLDIPALFPGLYEGGGYEIFLQRSWRHPCFMCWDGWRPADAQLREFAGTDAETLSLVQLAVPLSLAVLDPSCEHTQMIDQPDHLPSPPVLYVQNQHALAIQTVPRVRDCPLCGGTADEIGEASRQTLAQPASVGGSDRITPRPTQRSRSASRARSDDIAGTVVAALIGWVIWAIASYFTVLIVSSFFVSPTKDSKAVNTILAVLWLAPIGIGLVAWIVSLTQRD
ncbi:MAG: ThiF family adenylyltransferase [Candidatus Saccharimonadales bacterium]